MKKSCLFCKKILLAARSRTKFCSKLCFGKNSKGKKVGDGFWYENGYKVLYTEDGKGIKEHIKIMEEKIGRKITKNEVVHHINEIKDDNRIENLQLMTRSEHSSYHRKLEIKNGTFQNGRHGKSKHQQEIVGV